MASFRGGMASQSPKGPVSDPEPLVIEGVVRSPTRCRCGTVLPKGRRAIEISQIPEAANSLFRDQHFCSRPCVRAYFLESLETLDALDRPGAERTIRDIREVYQGLALSFSRLLVELESDSLPAAL